MVRVHRGTVVFILFLRSNLLVLPTTTTNWNVPECTSFGPVPSTGLAKVPRLREAVIIVVTELGVGGVAPRTLEGLVMRWPQPSLYQGP